MEYKDLADKPLESQLGKMIYDMFVVANQFQCLDILYEREYKKQQEEKKRQERLEQMRKGELAEIRLLKQAHLTGIKPKRSEDLLMRWNKKLLKLPMKIKKKKL